jgi:hypothetical protein
MSGSCPLTPTHAAPLQTEGAHLSPREARSAPANHAFAHAQRAHRHAHKYQHHKHNTRQNTTNKQATLAAAHAAAARDATRTLIPASAHASDHQVACEAAPRPRPRAHYSACSPKLHELGKHAIFMLHTRRRMAQLHGPVPCKQQPAPKPPAYRPPPRTRAKAAAHSSAASPAPLLPSLYSPKVLE